MWLLKESKNVKILVFCCSQYIAHFVSFWYFAVFFLQMNDHDWLLLDYLVPKFICFSHIAFVFFNTQINSWKSGNKRTIISWGVPLQNRKSNHNANEETTFARISKEAQGDFFIIIWYEYTAKLSVTAIDSISPDLCIVYVYRTFWKSGIKTFRSI